MLKDLFDNLEYKQKRLLFFGIGLVFLISIEYVLSNATSYVYDESHNKVSNHYLVDFKIKQTNKAGLTDWNLKGDKLEKFPNSMRSEVINPIMVIEEAGKENWNITANHALDPLSDFNEIYLTDNVKFNKFDNFKVSEIYITTSSAIVYPSEELIKTDAFTTIITPNSKTTGTGLIANIKEGYVKILSNARRLSYTKDRSEQLEGDQMLYNLKKKSWVLLKKENDDDANLIKERVKTILRSNINKQAN